MSTRTLLLLTCRVACSAPAQTYPVEYVERIELAPPAETTPPVADSARKRRVKSIVDLSGAWTTGSTNEPATRTIVRQMECNYSPGFWSIQQSGDTVRAWITPPSRAQGIARPPERRRMPAEGRLIGVNVTLKDDTSRYVLRYHAASGHLRGTLNGEPFWAVREERVQARDCIPVP